MTKSRVRWDAFCMKSLNPREKCWNRITLDQQQWSGRKIEGEAILKLYQIGVNLLLIFSLSSVPVKAEEGRTVERVGVWSLWHEQILPFKIKEKILSGGIISHVYV